MAKVRTRRWDPVEHLHSDGDRLAYLEAALAERDASLVAAALGDLARAKGMTAVAREAGLGRESLYKALSADGNPELATILKVLGALGLELYARPTESRALGSPRTGDDRPRRYSPRSTKL